MKETIDVFEILGQKKEPQLDVSKILTTAMKQNQEQQVAPDFDLYQIMKAKETVRPQKVAASKPVPAPSPQPVKPVAAPAASAPKQVPVPKTVAASAPKPVKPAATPVPSAPAKAPKAATPKHIPAPRPDKKPRRRRAMKLIIKLVAAVIVLMVVTAFVISGFKVTNDAMAPSVNKGDYVIVNKMAKSYEAGDVIMFRDYHEQKHFVRIVASDGDLVDIRMDGKLYINGEAEDNSDVIGETLITDQNIQYPLLIGENEYFVLGDNREAAVDSRNYIVGIINEDDIVGKVVFCVKKLN